MATLTLSGVYVLTFTAEETAAMRRIVQEHPRGEQRIVEVCTGPVREWVEQEQRVQAIARHKAYQRATPEARSASDAAIGFNSGASDGPSR